MAEASLRLAIFAGVLILMLCWERLAPARTATAPTALRRANNIAMVALDTLLLRLLFPVLAAGLAAERDGHGLFAHLSALVPLPGWLEMLLAVILFDLAIYWQHRLFHVVPALWRLHRVHHADPDVDVTTALRFHPGEIILSMAIKLALVWLLGPPALAVMIFEVLLNASAMFNHGNVALPGRLEAALRRIIVTPEMHCIHHMAHPADMNRNFGFCLSLWDRWFGSAAAVPHGSAIGLPGLPPEPRDLWIDRLLTMPWRRA